MERDRVGVFVYPTPIQINKQYERLALYPVGHILRYVSLRTHKRYKHFLGYSLDMGKVRYKVFYRKGLKCIRCGLQAQFFALEKAVSNGPNVRPHLNPYGVNEKGEEVLFTIDHFVPLSRGGSKAQDNQVVMCEHCNRKKGNKLENMDSYQQRLEGLGAKRTHLDEGC